MKPQSTTPQPEAPAPISREVEGLPEKLDVHSTGLFPMKAEIHPVNDPDGLIVLADVQTMELANELVKRYNAYQQQAKDIELLREALRGMIVHVEWREDFVIEDAEEGNTNCYTVAVEALKQTEPK